mmetsp:Transcript_54889/g.117788  ORF Transcript_54889/g.117788 Transcript_54889/m.117788 type:complete len:138 (+) Transcript_54889:77-490(+)|eukprot:CAMPEP_0180654524 /NCGR_PEP_ID=MMETSP1037_2-20121125/54744_1 /TAXON_ID=632150 /ORGANISM="Azadinium spinosum, Strain 3D9" /LENGTH=137 /DNA_ID=CAMNT_0022680805 /DNA_START=22 /DNA_END=435 /DNA_ORIENTATION=-
MALDAAGSARGLSPGAELEVSPFSSTRLRVWRCAQAAGCLCFVIYATPLVISPIFAAVRAGHCLSDSASPAETLRCRHMGAFFGTFSAVMALMLVAAILFRRRAPPEVEGGGPSEEYVELWEPPHTLQNGTVSKWTV